MPARAPDLRKLDPNTAISRKQRIRVAFARQETGEKKPPPNSRRRYSVLLRSRLVRNKMRGRYRGRKAAKLAAAG
jgi:hypothetical protein